MGARHMKIRWFNSFYRFLWVCVGLLFWPLPAMAQTVAPSSGAADVGTTVTGTAHFTIEGGSQQLTTLFHSFSEFSPETANVLFQLDNSQSSVETVIGRVTGSHVSFINGQIKLTGGSDPDLFLINPHGITFGGSATLSLPGSFVASSADSVLFSDGLSFSAIAPHSAPLLSVSRPIGLQFTAVAGDSQVGTLSVQGSGHLVSSSNPIFLPYTNDGTSVGLSVSAGETLGLIGRPLSLEGGLVSAAGGRVELGGVSAGTVGLAWKEGELSADYSLVEQFDDVSLLQQALVNISGAPAGTARMRGRDVSLSDGSLVWSQHFGGVAGDIAVQASEQLLLTGATPTVSAVSGVIAETVVPDSAGNVKVTAPRVIVQDGANIFSRSFSSGAGGSVTLDADQVDIRGYVPIAPSVFTSVGTTTISGSGAAGEVMAFVEHLSITDGGYFGSSTLGSGGGGNVTVDDADTILLSGAAPTGVPSIMTANTGGLTGDSGNLQVNTRELILQESALLTSSSIGKGNAGNVVIDASERVVVDGEPLGALPSSTISSTVDFPPLAYKLLLGLSGTPQGAAGSITITTPHLSIQDNSAVSVLNLGQGDAGRVKITVDEVSLNQGYIDALTVDGSGGEIDLTAGSLLLARNGSFIRTSARGGTGNGGDISISAPVVLGLGNSDIIANAFQGNGGNIEITTQRLLGLEFQEVLTAGDDITASSEFGLSGTVAVNGFDVSPNAARVKLPEGVHDTDEQLTAGCSVERGRFFATGRGGLSLSPAEGIAFNHPWQDVRPALNAAWSEVDPTSARRQTGEIALQPVETVLEPVLAEAANWSRNESDEIVLNAPGAIALGDGSC